jgi:outer membrane receptor for ferrienterochelin and colicins
MAMRRHIVACLALFALSAETSYAAGSITGRVTGGVQGEVIVGANVRLRGTTRGTSTDLQGRYRIPDVSPGTYTVEFSIVGYQRVVRSGVTVEEGKESVVDVSMIQSPIQADQVVVTANKREQSLQDVPVSISVVDAADIQQRNSLTIDEALRYVPGVNITGTQVNIRGSSGYSLGAGSRVLLLLDGVPFLAGDTGELNFESVPMTQVDRIEVVKGASSALYGSNALGGVVNVITKPIPDGVTTDVRLYGGLYSRFPAEQWKWTNKALFMRGGSITHTRKVGDLGISLFLSHHVDDGYRQNDFKHRYNFLLKAREDFAPLSSLTLNFGLENQYAGQFLYWRNLDSATLPPARHVNDDMLSTRYHISGLYDNAISQTTSITIKGLWYHTGWGFEQTGSASRTMSFADDFHLEALSTMSLGRMHTLTFGVEGNVDLISGDAFSSRTIGGAAAYAQDEAQLLEDLTLTVGGRFDFQTVGLTGETGQINPKVALSYRATQATTLRASFGQGFRVPSLPEAFVSAGSTGLMAVPNKDLKPEKSWSYEVGAKQTLGGIGALDISVFRSDYNNLIEPGLYTEGETILIQWRNVTKARVQGGEASLYNSFFDGGLNTNLGYTYVYPQDLTANDILKYRPRHIFYANAHGQAGWFTAAVDFRYVSRVERIDEELVDLGVIPDGDVRVPIYVTDVRVGADIRLVGVPLNVTVSVNNIFQHRYVELIGNIMPPRNYVLALGARL